MGIKYKINYNFFKTWSREMAYVLGCLYADGSLENSPYIRGKYIRFSSTDLSFVKNLRSFMSSEHTIVKIKPDGNRKVKYYLRIGSHAVYSDLEKLGLSPRKSLTMAFPYIPDLFVSDFVRGYLDGDGSIVIDKYKKNKNAKRLKTVFTSGSEMFLRKLDESLRQYCNIDGPNFYKSHKSFQLVYRCSKAKKVLDFIYKDLRERLFLDRKYTAYREALELLNLN
ncbi:LAGLIDADG family homing endonuclease [Candidatus Omnitrophota bacterium]